MNDGSGDITGTQSTRERDEEIEIEKFRRRSGAGLLPGKQREEQPVGSKVLLARARSPARARARVRVCELAETHHDKSLPLDQLLPSELLGARGGGEEESVRFYHSLSFRARDRLATQAWPALTYTHTHARARTHTISCVILP